MRRADMYRLSIHSPPPGALRALSGPIMGNLYLYRLFGDHTNCVIDYKLLLLAGNTGRGLFLNESDSSTYRGKIESATYETKRPITVPQVT